MKISKQLLLITSLFFILLGSMCSKKQLMGKDPAKIMSVQVDHIGPPSSEEALGSLSVTPEESLNEKTDIPDSAVDGADESAGPGDIPSSRRDFGEMPGDGSTGSFTAEPFSGSNSPQGKGMDSGNKKARRLPYRSSDHLKDIHFAFNRHDLDDTSKATLQGNVVYLRSHPESRITVQGHCDERGTNNYNLALSEQRARSARSYLVSQGIDENRIHMVGFGEEQPACFDNKEECWYQNRRAHFLVAKK